RRGTTHGGNICGLGVPGLAPGVSWRGSARTGLEKLVGDHNRELERREYHLTLQQRQPGIRSSGDESEPQLRLREQRLCTRVELALDRVHNCSVPRHALGRNTEGESGRIVGTGRVRSEK